MSRKNGRKNDQLRKVVIKTGEIKYAEGSALISFGDTKVLCTATIEETVPPFLRDTGTGWVTAEYSMLPRSTQDRNRRESVKGKIGGRSHEIQRLIGRVLRSAVDFNVLGERSIILDCDVLQADGGTRTASITGAYVALREAVNKLLKEGDLDSDPLTTSVAAVSVGIVDGKLMLDLNYDEDSRAQVDMNIAMNSAGEYIEVQGTAEEKPFSGDELQGLLKLAGKGIKKLIKTQNDCIKKFK